MADQTVLEQSLESQIVDEPFVSRQSVYVIDSNNGAYNGQIQIDTSSLSNSGRWASYSEGVLQIPLVVTLQAVAQTATTAQSATRPQIQNAANVAAIRAMRKQFALGLKNGHFQLIHSLSVEYNNTNVVQLTPYLNHYVTYKLLTTLSEDDLDKHGASIGFFPDSWESHDYDTSLNNNPNGKGSTNNKNLPNEGGYFFSSTSVQRSNYNKGLYKRSIKGMNQEPYLATTTPIVTEQNTKDLARNYYSHQIQNDVDAFFVVAQIRLKDISDFFDKLPLTRGAYMRLLINTNTAEHKLSYVVTRTGQYTTGLKADLGSAKVLYTTKAGATAVAITPAQGGSDQLLEVQASGSNNNYVHHLNCTSSTITGGSSPLVVASGDGPISAFTPADPKPQGGDFWGQATSAVGTGTFTTDNKIEFQFIARSSIAKDTTLNVAHPTFNNCRLYVPLYTMTNEEVKRYLTLQPTKHMVYRDIIQYQFDVEKGATFNQLLTNGIANPKALILIPYIHSESNPLTLTGGAIGGSGAGNEATSNNTAVWQSPFASEPGTTSPYVGIRDYNVQLAGVNVYTSNMLYDFEAFRNELARINGINGGVVDGLTSGLIGQDQFQTNMRYYVTDLSRRIKAEDAVPKSIQVSGTNASNVKMTVFAFLEFEKSADIALDSGLLLG